MTRPLVIDISKYDYDLNPQNVDGIIQRTSYHDIIDQRYEQLSKKVNQVPIREAYHYYGKTTPWYPQVELFCRLTLDNPDTTYQRVWIDAEEDKWGNEFDARMCNEIGEFLRLVRHEFENVGVYANRDGYYHLESHLGADYMNEFPLWLADPRESVPTEIFVGGWGEPQWGVWRRDGEGKLFLREFKRPKGSWAYWQTSFLGSPVKYGLLPNEEGETKKAVDENVYNGTIRDLRRDNGVSLPVFYGKRIVMRSRRFSARLQMAR